MKQAILITAYKNYSHLEEIIKFFDSNFELYIHIDKKSKISNDDLNNLKKYEVVKLISQKFNVNWGGLNHLRSILYLSEQALKSSNNYYFHLISGHDFPIKKKAYFLDFFKNNKSEYINFFEFPTPFWNGNGGMDRITYYNLYDVLDAKKHKENKLIRYLINWQKKLGLKRSICVKFPKIYIGQTWWSLSRECLEYVVKYNKENKFLLNRFKYTFCSEEFYFQTIIMNSPFAVYVKNENLRYIDWIERNGNSPAILDNSDYEKIMDSGAFFARKFDYPISQKLYRNIKFFFEEC